MENKETGQRVLVAIMGYRRILSQFVDCDEIIPPLAITCHEFYCLIKYLTEMFEQQTDKQFNFDDRKMEEVKVNGVRVIKVPDLTRGILL